LKITLEIPNRDKYRYSLVCFSEILNDGSIDYIGDLKMSESLLGRGIRPELAKKGSKVCSVGFCEKDKKWYGWSHRRICGFPTRKQAVTFAGKMS